MREKLAVIIAFVVVLSMPAAAYPEQHRHQHAAGDEHQSAEGEDKDYGRCPVMGNEAKKEHSYSYEGETYYFCCAWCIGEFKKDPQKYIDKLEEGSSRREEFRLESYQFGFKPRVIKVSKGDRVKIEAFSRDVPHGVSIQEYDINVQVEKGKPQIIEFTADKAGEFDILCSVYCGPGHHQMQAKLIVEDK